jgi:PAS domain S-box-containing protein
MVLALVFLLIYHDERMDADRLAQRELESISALKTQQVASWYQERLNDARFVSNSALIARESVALLLDASPGRTGPAVPTWMTSMFRNGHYASIRLLDRENRLVCSVPGQSARDEEGVVGVYSFPREAGAVVVRDLCRLPDGRRHLDLMVPVYDRSGSSTLLGVFVLDIDPATELYPILRFWPVPRNTAYCQLTRREGGEIVYLNPFPGAGNEFQRVPLEKTMLHFDSSGRRTTVVASVDYRGIDCQAAVTAVPGTAWRLSAKMDTEELYRQMWKTVGTLWLAVIAIFIGVVALLSTLRSRRKLRELDRDRVAREERELLLERVGLLMKNANDAIWTLDADLNILDVNDRALAMFGYTREEFLRLNLAALRVETASGVEEPFSAAAAVDGIRHERLHRRKDGAVFPAEVSTRSLALHGTWMLLSIIRDISTAKEAERQILALNRTLSMLSKITQLTFRCRTVDELFQEACRIAVEDGRFVFVWIGAIDTGTSTVRSVAMAGEAPVPEGRLVVSLELMPEGMGPSGTAVREGRVDVCNHVSADPRMKPWHHIAAQAGTESAAAFPLYRDGEVMGAMTLYAVEQGFFDEAEIELLTRLAMDVSHAVDFYERERFRIDAEEQLRKQHDLLMRVMETSPLGIAMIDRNGMVEYANGRADVILPMSLERIVAMGPEQSSVMLYHPDGAPMRQEESPVRAALNSDRTVRDARILVGQEEGERILLSVNVSPIHSAAGLVDGVVAIFEDITDRERTQEGMRRMQSERDALLRRLQLQFEHLPLAFLLQDHNMRILDWNPAAKSIFGYSIEDIVGRSVLEALFTEHSRPIVEQLTASLSRSDDTLIQIVETGTKSGALLLCEWHFTPLRDDLGRFIGVIAMAADVTERVQAARALADSERRFSLFMSHLPAFAWIKDAEGRYLFANEMLASGLNATGDSLIGRSADDLMRPPFSMAQREHDQHVLSSGVVSMFEETLELANGLHTALACIFPILRDGDTPLLGGIALDITERKRAEEMARQYAEQLRRLSSRLTEVEEAERKNLAQELHDDIGQSLTALMINLNLVQSQLSDGDRDRVGGRLEDSLSLVESTIESTRSIMSSLRPAMLDDYGLLTAVRWFAGTIRKRFGLEVEVAGREFEPRLPQSVEMTLFRSVQEALHNVLKHANAQLATVDFSGDAEHCVLTISDDGTGFDTGRALERTVSHGWGLVAIRERAEALGGSLLIHSSRAEGTRIVIQIPR